MNNRYLKSITLQNFQSYKNETIEFNPGLNLLLGTSDSGKSAIMRAISFVLYNTPRKDSFIHWGATEMRVTLEFSDGTKVTRIKGEGINAIEAVDSSGNILEKSRIDTEIPEDIKALLGNPPQDDLNGLISYADQFSKMFLVDLSPTDLPRSLSNLTGIEVLEESAKQLMSNYKAIDKQIRQNEKEYTKLINESQSYSYVNDYEKKILRLQSDSNKVSEFAARIQSMESLIADIDLDFDETCLSAYTSFLESIDLALSQVRSMITFAHKLSKLEMFAMWHEDSVDDNDLQSLYSVLDHIASANKSVVEFKEKIVETQNLQKISDDYDVVNTAGSTLASEYKKIQQEILDMEKDYNDYKKFLNDQNIQCEACGSILKW